MTFRRPLIVGLDGLLTRQTDKPFRRPLIAGLAVLAVHGFWAWGFFAPIPVPLIRMEVATVIDPCPPAVAQTPAVALPPRRPLRLTGARGLFGAATFGVRTDPQGAVRAACLLVSSGSAAVDQALWSDLHDWRFAGTVRGPIRVARRL